MSEQQHVERFFWFHDRIKAGRFPNSRHLVHEFGISERTAHRVIEFMRDRFNAPLEFDRRHNGFHYTDASFEIPGYWISEANVLALSLAVRLASTIPDPSLKDDLCRLINRMTRMTGGDGQNCLQQVERMISVKNIEYAMVDTAIFRQTVAALFKGGSLRITYHSPHGKGDSTRTIQPLHLMHYMGSWHLIAWCASRNGLRDFALARIKSLAPTAEKVKVPADLPNLKEYTRRHFGIMQGNATSRIVLEFSPQISPWIREQCWHQEQTAHIAADGALRLTFPAADFRELVKTVLSHGAEIRVIEPPELKLLVQQEIDKMTKIYDRVATP